MIFFNSKVNPQLSAMYKLPGGCAYKEGEGPSIEIVYQAAKCKHPADKSRMLMLNNPFDAKKLSKSVAIRNDWNNVKVPIMRALCKSAAERNHPVASFLRNSGEDLLLHYAPWDEFWGSGRYGNGSNMMGRIWIDVRKEMS